MWKLIFEAKPKKLLKKLDRSVKIQILKYLNQISKSPRSFGKALTGNKIGLWRYRVGDYRIICNIKDDELIILIVDLGHRKEIYKR